MFDPLCSHNYIRSCTLQTYNRCIHYVFTATSNDLHFINVIINVTLTTFTQLHQIMYPSCIQRTHSLYVRNYIKSYAFQTYKCCTQCILTNTLNHLHFRHMNVTLTTFTELHQITYTSEI